MSCFLNGITVKCHFCFEIVALHYWLLDPGVSMFFPKYQKEGNGGMGRKKRKNFSDINVLLKLCVFKKKREHDPGI